MTSGAAEAKVNASRTQAVCIFILVALVYLREKEHFFLRRCSGYFSIDFKTIKKFSAQKCKWLLAGGTPYNCFRHYISVCKLCTSKSLGLSLPELKTTWVYLAQLSVCLCLPLRLPVCMSVCLSFILLSFSVFSLSLFLSCLFQLHFFRDNVLVNWNWFRVSKNLPPREDG